MYKNKISNQSNSNKKLVDLDIFDEKQNLLNTKADFHRDIVGVDSGETDFVTIFSNGKVQNFNKMIDSRTCVTSVSTKQFYSRSGFNTKKLLFKNSIKVIRQSISMKQIQQHHLKILVQLMVCYYILII